MTITNEFAKITALIAEPARATMLWSLLDGRAYTASELAIVADVSPQSASNHLGKLADNNLVSIEKQGRHRYYQLANPEVAYVIESIANLIQMPKQAHNAISNATAGITYARTCYDHLAGKVGVHLTQSLLDIGWLVVNGKSYRVTKSGQKGFGLMGIDLEELEKSKRSFAHQCLDWSERKHHLAGALGAAVLAKMIEKDWIRRKSNSREVIITHLGQEKIQKLFKLDLA